MSVNDVSPLITSEPVRKLSGADLGFASTAASDAPSKREIEVTPDDSLIGIPLEVYRQINGALNGGKTHLVFYGPPGTGKSTLAQAVARQLIKGREIKPELLTASSDWSSQDLIGGYQPIGQGLVGFRPGFLLRSFDRPVIIDELNRCDIDKVLGPLFSLLTGADSTLPYVAEPSDRDSKNLVILADPQFRSGPDVFSPGPDWKILGTMNTSDKATLASMSFALMRRFGWIYVGVPQDKHQFVAEWCKRVWGKELKAPKVPLADFWEDVCTIRKLGAAPFVDILQYCRALDVNFDPSDLPDDDAAEAYIDAVIVYLIPLLDPLRTEEADSISNSCMVALQLSNESAALARLREHLDENVP